MPRLATSLVHDGHEAMDVEVVPGGQLKINLTIDDLSYSFEDARVLHIPPGPIAEDSRWHNFQPYASLPALSPGKYTVTTSYEHAGHDQ